MVDYPGKWGRMGTERSQPDWTGKNTNFREELVLSESHGTGLSGHEYLHGKWFLSALNAPWVFGVARLHLGIGWKENLYKHRQVFAGRIQDTFSLPHAFGNTPRQHLKRLCRLWNKTLYKLFRAISSCWSMQHCVWLTVHSVVSFSERERGTALMSAISFKHCFSFLWLLGWAFSCWCLLYRL